MAVFSRHVTVDWQGTLLEGKGTAKAGSGAFDLPATFPRRIGEPEGTTSPEELIAAAHGTCYAMVVAANLGRRNASADRTQVVCTVTGEKTDAGLKVVSSKLQLTAEGLKGIDAAAFTEMAKQAEGGCPISNALRGNVAIEVEVVVK
jgi:osmotically inducible protein OsmC